jgi:hypothetical protein
MMLVTPAPVPPTGNLKLPPSNLRLSRSLIRGSTLSLLSTMNSMLLRVVKAQVAVAVLVGNFADFTDVGGAHEAGAAAADREDLVAGFGHMDQNTGFQNFMIQPFALVLGDDRRIKLSYFRGPMSVIRFSIGLSGL